jgi:hypothetical protein
MAFSLTFHSLEEKIPAHDQEIAFFDTRITGYGFQNMDLKYGKVYYVWDNGNGTQWTYDGEEEFIYDDGTKPEEEMQLIFCIEHDDAGWEYGPVSNIKEYFRKRIHWTDSNQLVETVPEDGGEVE